ncbi:TPA: hypothetical protein ACF2DD_001962 [Clostridium perfringens]
MSTMLLNGESCYVVDTYKEVLHLQQEMYEHNNVINFRVVKVEKRKKGIIDDEYYKVTVKIENVSEKDCRGADMA